MAHFCVGTLNALCAAAVLATARSLPGASHGNDAAAAAATATTATSGSGVAGVNASADAAPPEPMKQAKPIRYTFPDGVVPHAVAGDLQSVSVCKLNFNAVRQGVPQKAPLPGTFADLVRLSACGSPTATLFEVPMADIPSVALALRPAGFVFHQAQSSAPLVTTMLASDPDNLVYAGHTPAGVCTCKLPFDWLTGVFIELLPQKGFFMPLSRALCTSRAPMRTAQDPAVPAETTRAAACFGARVYQRMCTIPIHARPSREQVGSQADGRAIHVRQHLAPGITW